MCDVHPELTRSVVEQTPRAMVAMIIVSSVYFWIFLKFVPLSILLIWFLFQILLAMYRFYNSKMLQKFLEKEDRQQTKKHEIYFLIANVFQAIMWTIASVLSVIYAPQPFELVTFVMIIGIITAAALSMSSLYTAYLAFFFSMIIPQIVILYLYGEHQHIGLIILAVVYIPATILLSKAIYSNRLSTILANDALSKNIEELHKLSITDSLTDLYNRRYFFEVSQNMISTALRESKVISFLMIDLDHFKKVNDLHGHDAGDFILIEFAKEIQTVIRESDIFARVGGEEFMIILNDTSSVGAKIIAEKIRKLVESKEFIYKNLLIEITVSIGISVLNNEDDSIEKLYKKADEQLYKAKENGRNRVC